MSKQKSFFYYILCGFFLGISAFAPGFSGSVMAITLGVYNELVQIMSNPLKELKKNLSFFIPIAIGIGLSGVAFVLVFNYLFDNHQRATFMLFVGLIIGNLPVIGQEVRLYPIQKRAIVGGLVCFAIALGLSLAGIGASQMTGDASSNVILIEVIISGFVAGAIMLVPGMSISAILIMLGVYGQLITMVNDILRLNFTYFPTLLAIVIAAVAGLVLTARLVKRLFQRFPGFAYTCVFGFMAGTFIGIFVESFYVQDTNFTWLIGISTFLAGLGVSALFILLGKKMSRKMDG